MLIIKTVGQFAKKAVGAAILGAIMLAAYLLWEQNYLAVPVDNSQSWTDGQGENTYGKDVTTEAQGD